MRKGEIACNKQFLLFSQCFLPYMAIFHFKMLSAICLDLDQSKILLSGKCLVKVSFKIKNAFLASKCAT